MAKRITIKNIHQLAKEVNKYPHINVNPRVTFRGYVLSFNHEDLTPDETTPMTCKECYCYLLGMLRNAQNTDNTEKFKILEAQQEYLFAEVNEYKARIAKNAKGLHNMYIRAITAEKEATLAKAEVKPLTVLATAIRYVLRDYLDEIEEMSL